MPEAPRHTENEPVVQSVDRAIVAMEILAREGWAGVTDIARELGIHKSTVFRLLSTLERRGFVEQDPESQKYRLGFGVVRLASSVRASLDLVQESRPVCDRLSLETDETVNIAVLEGAEVVNIHQVNLSTSRVGVNWVGRHTALHCTSSGKVFLAFLPAHIVGDLLDGDLERFTTFTITDPAVLEQELALIRRDGYAMTFEELEDGLNAVGAPIYGPDGSLVAAVSVSGPSYRLVRGPRLDQVAELTREAADEISRRIGYLGEARFVRSPVG